MDKRNVSKFLLVIGTLFIFGCAEQITLKPDIKPIYSPLVIHGKIDYVGKLEYLPKTISEDETSMSDIIIKYSFDVSYPGTMSAADIIPLFNPTTILGTPTSSNEISIKGKLEIYRALTLLKSYIAECNIEKPRSLYTGGNNYTEIRRRGLLRVKENIEFQMMYDRDYLNTINKKF